MALRDKYIFLKVPKVASTSLTVSLGKMETRDFARVKPMAHPGPEASVFIRPFQLPDDMANTILADEAYKRFTFVRHPYSRILSAYKHRVVGEETNTKRQVLRTLYGEPVDMDRDVGFDDFLSALEQLQPSVMDTHYRPQVLLTGAGVLRHDFVGKLENLADDLVRLEDWLGLPLSEYMTERIEHYTGAGETWRDHATPERARRIRDLYHRDFETFGYNI